ncbi:MAG: hypothetical protein JO263_01580 [Candidatus Eremiobacteraeota bacterium]|nr:hypothetical protein [Candidatus Eremiobacteraeota bacterium]
MKTAREAISRLANRHRVLILGGIAVIAHGLPRATQDVDIWLDPSQDIGAWADVVRRWLVAEGLTCARATERVGLFAAIESAEIERVASADSFIRALGADRPIDVFFQLRNLERSDFDPAWHRARPLQDGPRVLDAVDLLLTKLGTERDHDAADAQFLERRIEAQYKDRLRHCSFEEATMLLQRFATPEILAFAATDSDEPRVRKIAGEMLEEMARSGDPYAVDLAARLRRARPGV